MEYLQYRYLTVDAGLVTNTKYLDYNVLKIESHYECRSDNPYNQYYYFRPLGHRHNGYSKNWQLNPIQLSID